MSAAGVHPLREFGLSDGGLRVITAAISSAVASTVVVALGLGCVSREDADKLIELSCDTALKQSAVREVVRYAVSLERGAACGTEGDGSDGAPDVQPARMPGDAWGTP